MFKALLFSFFSFTIISICSAQTLLKGRVVDAISRQPLEHANIIEDGNAKSNTTTDNAGNFLINVNRINAVLITSFIGYKPSTINVEGRKEIKIELQPDVVNLKDVVLGTNIGQQKFSTLARADLNLNPVKNSQELLRLVPGLFVAQHAGGGKAEQIFLRGFDCDHGTDIEVTVDGLPINMVSHAHGHGYADAHFIIPETVNNVDYGTGPYYTQHGNLNTAGYVSFSTFNNIARSQVQVEAGRYNTFRTLAMVDLLKGDKEKQSAYIAAEYNYTNGPTVNAQNFNRFNLFGKYNLSLSPNTRLTASVSGFKSKWDASGQVPERAVREGLIDRFGSIDPSEGGNTERYNVNVLFSHSGTNNTTWENQAYFSRNIFSLFSNFTFYLNDPVNGDAINQAEKRNIVGYNSRFSKKSIWGNVSLKSTYGVGIRYDAIKDSYLAQTPKRQLLSYTKQGDINEYNLSGYTQQQVNIGNWLLEGGVRFDQLNFNYFDRLSMDQLPAQSKSIVSPKLNVQYTINKKVQLYSKVGKGFHSNDTRVVVANGGQKVLPAAYDADFGIILKSHNNFLVNIAAWYLRLDQEFVYVGDEGIIEPSGKSLRKGIDVIARYQINSRLFANANFNITKPRALSEPKGANYIPLAPTFTSTGGIYYKKKEGLNGGLSYRYITDRPANEDNSIVANGYFIVDATVNYTKPKYEVGVALENVFNAKWNEAQFATESRLFDEPAPITELNFTPGMPFFIRAKVAMFF